VMCKPEPAGTRLLKISVADGQVQDLLRGNSTVDRILNRAEFSPDGRFVAYGQEGLIGPVFVIPAQGGESRLVAGDAFLVDWTRDGRYLVVGVPMGNSVTLSAVPISDGQSAGERIPLRAVPGTSARIMSSGALLVSTGTQGGRAVSLGTLEAN